MVNLSFIALKLAPKNRQKKVGASSEQKNVNFRDYFSNSKDTKMIAKDVTSEMKNGQHWLKTKYAIIFLYDFLNDQESREFISTYGWKLHYQSSASITLVTYHSPEMVEKWHNVQFREKLKTDFNSDPFKIMEMVENLQKKYNVNKLPSMVILKKDYRGNVESLNIDVSLYNRETLKSLLKDTMEIINDNYEEKFSVISQKICGPDFEILSSCHREDDSTYYHIYDLIKSESKGKKLQYTQADLAAELGITAKSLYNKRIQKSFTRDELIYIAIRFGLSIQKLNGLLRENNHSDLGIDGRDSVIRNGLYQKLKIKEVDQELIIRDYMGIIKEKT